MSRSVLRAAVLFCSCLGVVQAQDTVRSWYANGQVWVVWRISAPFPETCEIYSGATPFTDVSQAELLGRLFEAEWRGERLKLANPALRYSIPDGSGGVYRLRADEGVFAFTPHMSGQAYFAVVRAGQSGVSAVNRTTSEIAFDYAPDTDPVTPHLQVQGTLSGYPYSIYAMWVDGADDPDAGRPDFPIMANAARRGIPHVFGVIEPLGGLSAESRPCTLLLHGGGGQYISWTPASADKARINITPVEGITVAHDDVLYRRAADGVVAEHTWWYGWGQGYNPFVDPPAQPDDAEVLINYTMRRIEWINTWLVSAWNVDPDRISILGHSMGGRGAGVNARWLPQRYSSAVLLCPGIEVGDSRRPVELLGAANQNLATNLRDRFGNVVRAQTLWRLSENLSAQRDLGLIRVFSGKGDTTEQAGWSSTVTDNFRASDAARWGMHLYWDERTHSPGDWDGYWANGDTAAFQTQRDDVSYQSRYRAAQSFPAFSSDDQDTAPGRQPDPGDGQSSSGDAYGTWGGFYDWDTYSIVDNADEWSCTIWLVGASANQVDVYPSQNAVADVTIRKPQAFLPSTGTLIHWELRRVSDNVTLQSGFATPGVEDVVTIPAVTISKDPDRVRLIVRQGSPEGEGGLEGLAEGITEASAEGSVEGAIEGMLEGLAEGLQEGHVEGSAEGNVEGSIEGSTEGIAEGTHEGEDTVDSFTAVVGDNLRITVPNPGTAGIGDFTWTFIPESGDTKQILEETSGVLELTSLELNNSGQYIATYEDLAKRTRRYTAILTVVNGLSLFHLHTIPIVVIMTSILIILRWHRRLSRTQKSVVYRTR